MFIFPQKTLSLLNHRCVKLINLKFVKFCHPANFCQQSLCYDFALFRTTLFLELGNFHLKKYPLQPVIESELTFSILLSLFARTIALCFRINLKPFAYAVSAVSSYFFFLNEQLRSFPKVRVYKNGPTKPRWQRCAAWKIQRTGNRCPDCRPSWGENNLNVCRDQI